MKKILITIGMAALAATATARGFDLNVDLPFDIGFQIGFTVEVVPSEADTSHYLGLGVTADEIITDKVESLIIHGRITNYGDVPVEGLAMRFAVSSHIHTGMDKSTAFLSSDTVPPRSSVAYTARVQLSGMYPKYAMYTITARSPDLLSDAAERYDDLRRRYETRAAPHTEAFGAPDGEHLTLDDLESEE